MSKFPDGLHPCYGSHHSAGTVFVHSLSFFARPDYSRPLLSPMTKFHFLSSELPLAGSLFSRILSRVELIDLDCPDQSPPLPFPTGQWLAFFLSSDQSSLGNISSVSLAFSPASVHLAFSLFPLRSDQFWGLLPPAGACPFARFLCMP